MRRTSLLDIRRASNVEHEPQVHDITGAKEKQATPKAAFVFLAVFMIKNYTSGKSRTDNYRHDRESYTQKLRKL